jgi:hypothetical protein
MYVGGRKDDRVVRNEDGLRTVFIEASSLSVLPLVTSNVQTYEVHARRIHYRFKAPPSHVLNFELGHLKLDP